MQANQTKPRADIKKWPAYFKELGYEVVAFGKVAHYGTRRAYGFDHFEHDTFHDPEGIPCVSAVFEASSAHQCETALLFCWHKLAACAMAEESGG